MERLTFKRNTFYSCNKLASEFDGGELIRANQKLGPLEDIEEELGIDLLTLYKALTDGIYVRCVTEDGFEHFVWISGKWNFIDKENKCLNCFLDAHPRKLFFTDYGDVWAVTEEELIGALKDDLRG